MNSSTREAEDQPPEHKKRPRRSVGPSRRWQNCADALYAMNGRRRDAEAPCLFRRAIAMRVHDCQGFLLAYTRTSRDAIPQEHTQNTPHPPHPAPTAARTQDESEIGKGTLRVPYHHRRRRRPHHHRPPCSPLPPHHEPDGGLGSQQPFWPMPHKTIFRASHSRSPSASFFTSTVRFVANFRPCNYGVITSNYTTSKLPKKYPGIYTGS